MESSCLVWRLLKYRMRYLLGPGYTPKFHLLKGSSNPEPYWEGSAHYTCLSKPLSFQDSITESVIKGLTNGRVLEREAARHNLAHQCFQRMVQPEIRSFRIWECSCSPGYGLLCSVIQKHGHKKGPLIWTILVYTKYPHHGPHYVDYPYFAFFRIQLL